MYRRRPQPITKCQQRQTRDSFVIVIHSSTTRYAAISCVPCTPFVLSLIYSLVIIPEMSASPTSSSPTPPNGNINGIRVDRASIRAEVTGPDLPSTPVTHTRPLEMKPVSAPNKYGGGIANSPLSVATISFILGVVFSFGLAVCFLGNSWGFWWSRYQLGIYISSWAAFHWGEFAVTAGWNREKVSVDCKFA